MAETNTPPKRRGLSMPTDPLAAMRELQELSQTHPRSTGPEEPEKSLQERNITNLQEIKEENNKASFQENKIESLEERKQTEAVTEAPVTPAAVAPEVPARPEIPAAPEPATPSRDEKITQVIASLQGGRVDVVSFRLPTALSDYVDRWVALQPRKADGRKYLKQDAMMEALAAFLVDHPLPDVNKGF